MQNDSAGKCEWKQNAFAHLSHLDFAKGDLLGYETYAAFAFPCLELQFFNSRAKPSYGSQARGHDTPTSYGDRTQG